MKDKKICFKKILEKNIFQYQKLALKKKIYLSNLKNKFNFNIKQSILQNIFNV